MRTPIATLRSSILLGSLLGALVLPAGAQSRLKELENEVKDVVSRVSRAVVRVDAYRQVPAAIRVQARASGGRVSVAPLAVRHERFNYSGLVVLEGNLVLTVPEALLDTDSVRVRVRDGRELAASPVGIDRRLGIGVLEVAGLDTPAVPIAESTNVEVGSLVVTVGNPFGLVQSPALGVVSGIRRTPGATPDGALELLQISAPVNPGDYGGAVANSDGEIVGMIVSSFRRERTPTIRSLLGVTAEESDLESFFRFVDENVEGAPPELEGSRGRVIEGLFFEWLQQRYEETRAGEGEGATARAWIAARSRLAEPEPEPEQVNFVIPIRTAVDSARAIVANRGAARAPSAPWLGLRVRLAAVPEPEPGEAPTRLEVIEVFDGGPAANAGIRPLDVLRRFAGRPVADIEALREVLAGCRVGQEIEIAVSRDGEPLDLRVSLQGSVSVVPKAAESHDPQGGEGRE